jgi:cytochrome d ubiquinol oxidase subunit II
MMALLAVGMFSLVAGNYLLLETKDRKLKNDFRKRALGSAIATGLILTACALTAAGYAPDFYRSLSQGMVSVGLHLLLELAVVGEIWALWSRRNRLARLLVWLVAGLVWAEWVGAQFPCLIVPDLVFSACAAPPSFLAPLLIALGLGSPLLVVCFVYLFRTFKKQQFSGIFSIKIDE